VRVCARVCVHVCEFVHTYQPSAIEPMYCCIVPQGIKSVFPGTSWQTQAFL